MSLIKNQTPSLTLEDGSPDWARIMPDGVTDPNVVKLRIEAQKEVLSNLYDSLSFTQEGKIINELHGPLRSRITLMQKELSTMLLYSNHCDSDNKVENSEIMREVHSIRKGDTVDHSYSLAKSPPAIDNQPSSFIDQNPDANFYKSIPIKQADFGLESTPSVIPLN